MPSLFERSPQPEVNPADNLNQPFQPYIGRKEVQKRITGYSPFSSPSITQPVQPTPQPINKVMTPGLGGIAVPPNGGIVPTAPVTAPVESTGYQGNTQLTQPTIQPVTPAIPAPVQPTQQGGGVIAGIFGGGQNTNPIQSNFDRQTADRQQVIQQGQLQRQNQMRPSLAQNKIY